VPVGEVGAEREESGVAGWAVWWGDVNNDTEDEGGFLHEERE